MSDKSWEPGMYECLNVLNNFCFHVYAQNLLSHFLTLTLSHSHSFSLSHSFNLSFNHSRHAEQLLFSSLCSKITYYCRKLQWFFLDHIITTLTCYFRVHRAGSQLKIIEDDFQIQEDVIWVMEDYFYTCCMIGKQSDGQRAI